MRADVMRDAAADLHHHLKSARATPTESVEDITGLYRRRSVHSDVTVETLPLDDAGSVPWWREYHDRLERVARTAGAR